MKSDSEQLLSNFSPETRDAFLRTFTETPAAFVAALLQVYRNPALPQSTRDHALRSLRAAMSLVTEALGSIEPSDVVDVDQMLEVGTIAIQLERMALGLPIQQEL